MRRKGGRGFTLAMAAVLLCTSAAVFGQEANEGKETKEVLYEQLVRGVIRLEEHQAVCTSGREFAIEKDLSVGTAFFVRDRLPGKDNSGENRYFIVTARHVVEQRADLFARVQAGPKSETVKVLVLPRAAWVFHPAPTPPGQLPIDVAVMPIRMEPFVKMFLHCDEGENPNGCGLKSDGKPYSNQVGGPSGVTDRVVFFGFPDMEVSKKAVQPFARAGIVAYSAPSPDLIIGGTRVADGLVFYVDAPAFSGNSGGPVLLEPGAFQGAVRVIGLVTGGSTVGRDYAIATSVQRIHETLKHARSAGIEKRAEWVQEVPALPIQCRPSAKGDGEKAGEPSQSSPAFPH